MPDLNDLAFFAAVVEHQGFAAASRALKIPKSSLSRRVAALEEALGARLLQRTSRRFAVTAQGQDVLVHAKAMLEAADAAMESVAAQSRAPSGVVRLACPPTLFQSAMEPIVFDLMQRYPLLRLQVEATNRNVDVWTDGVDIALRVRPASARLPAHEIVRQLGSAPHVLVATPRLLASAPRPATLEDVLALPTLGLGNSASASVWTLQAPDGQWHRLAHIPRLLVSDMAPLRSAALAGLGCALLPQVIVRDELQNGQLQEVLPGWAPEPSLVQAVYASRKGMRTAVRAVLDALVEGFPAVRAGSFGRKV